VAAVGGSDSHAHVDPVGRPQVAVYAEALSRPALVEALRRGRSYLAESAGVSVEFTARCGKAVAGPGEDLPVPPGAPVSVRARISGAPGTTVVMRTAAGTAATARVGESGDTSFAWDTSGSGSRFVRVEVRRPRRLPGLPGTMVALTNPVWLRPAG
jgi:hypothetical protein